jgi:pyruvate,water dikinase
MDQTKQIVWFSDEDSSQVGQLGGKNASLGEMTRNMRAQGIPVPDGFAVTAGAYWMFVDSNKLRQPIGAELQGIREQKLSLAAGAKRIRQDDRTSEVSDCNGRGVTHRVSQAL